MLFGVNFNSPFKPTSTESLRKPPLGSLSTGSSLGFEAFNANALKASNVFSPESGLKLVLVNTKWR